MRRVSFYIFCLFLLGFSAMAAAGTWTTNKFIYKPAIGARGEKEKADYDSGLDRVDSRLGREIWVGDPNYGNSIQSAVAAIGSNCVTLRLPAGTHVIATDFIIPANITLKPEWGAVLSITDKTLTFNGSFDAGPYQTFACDGGGKVVFAGPIKEVYPQWWGAKGDDGIDCAAALQAAIDTSLPVYIPPGKYRFGTKLTFANSQVIRGAGQNKTSLFYTGSDSYGLYAKKVVGLALQDFTLDGCLSTNSTGIFCDLEDWPCALWSVSRITVQNFSNYQVKGIRSWAMKWQDCSLVGREDYSSKDLYYDWEDPPWGLQFENCWFRRIANGCYGIKSSATASNARNCAFGGDGATRGGGVALGGSWTFESCNFETLGKDHPAILLNKVWTKLLLVNNQYWPGITHEGPQSGPSACVKVASDGVSNYANITIINDDPNYGGNDANGYWSYPLVDCANHQGFIINIMGANLHSDTLQQGSQMGMVINAPENGVAVNNLARGRIETQWPLSPAGHPPTNIAYDTLTFKATGMYRGGWPIPSGEMGTVYDAQRDITAFKFYNRTYNGSDNPWNTTKMSWYRDVPYAGTWRKADIVWNILPEAGTPPGWVCTDSGTNGTLSGVTGNIQSGSNLLTVNTLSDLVVGDYIRVPGAAAGGGNLDTSITAISGTTVTVTDAAGTSVTGAAISWRSATFKAMANLAP